MPRFLTKMAPFYEFFVAALCLVFARPTYASVWVGAALIVVGVVVRVFCASTRAASFAHAALAPVGPYRIARHPQVLGQALTVVGAVLACRNIYLVLFTLALLAIAYPWVARRSDRNRRDNVGSQYAQYLYLTPGFFPQFFPFWHSRATDRPFNLRAGLRKELKSLCLFTMLLLVLYLRGAK